MTYCKNPLEYMNKFITKLKVLNWKVFWIVLGISLLLIITDKGTNNFTRGLTIMLTAMLPIAFLAAWITKKHKP